MNVHKTYDIIAEWFSRNRSPNLLERNYLNKMIAITGRRASYLDLGCGTGGPIMKYLLEQGIDATGVDGSNHMLEIAKKNLPSAKFIATDPQQTNTTVLPFY